MIEIENRLIVDNLILNKIFAENNLKMFSLSKRFILTKNTQIKPSDFELKIRISQTEGLINVKKRNWSNIEREDIEFHFNKRDLSNILKLFQMFGVNKYYFAYITRQKFLLEDLIFSVEKYHNANKSIISIVNLIDYETERTQAEKRIMKFLIQYNLTPALTTDIKNFIEEINTISQNQIDFSYKDIKGWEEKAMGYINCEE